MEIKDWLWVAFTLVGILIAIVIPLIAYFNSTMTKNSHLINEHKTHVAETYATKNEVEKLGDRIERNMERQMKTGFDNLKELIKNIKFKDVA